MNESIQQPALEGKGVGWFRAMRSPEAMELLLANAHAFILAYVIAYRGQYSDTFNRHNLHPGEALLGDFKNYGMSEREYRTAKHQLAKWGFATFKATGKGTVGTLTDSRLFSIFRLESDGQKDRQPTDDRRTTDGRPTDSRRLPRTKEGKNDKNIRTKEASAWKTESIDPTK